jgi:uncharacterized protein with PQ loop repeat
MIGWIGSLLLSFCGLPQASKTYRTRKADDLSWGFLGMWGMGEVFTFIYVLDLNLAKGEYQYPLLANYSINFVIICYLVYVKCFYKGEING